MPTLAELSTEITLSVGTVLGWALAIIGALAAALVHKDRQVGRALATADRATRVMERMQQDVNDDGDV